MLRRSSKEKHSNCSEGDRKNRTEIKERLKEYKANPFTDTFSKLCAQHAAKESLHYHRGERLTRKQMPHSTSSGSPPRRCQWSNLSRYLLHWTGSKATCVVPANSKAEVTRRWVWVLLKAIITDVKQKSSVTDRLSEKLQLEGVPDCRKLACQHVPKKPCRPFC